MVSKLEANARLEARDRDPDDDASRRSFRRGRLRGEAAASGEVAAVEAVAAPDEVVADEIALNPGDVTKPPE